MSRFTEVELQYLQTQQLGRLATVNQNGEPENKPVAFRYNAEYDTIDIGGPAHTQSQKFLNVRKNGFAALVIDDLTEDGGRGIEIRAHAEIALEGGQAIVPSFSPEVIRLTPKRILTWDISKKLLPISQRNIS